MEGGSVIGGLGVERRLLGYREYLLVERGVMEVTALAYEPVARRLLVEWGDLEQLTAAGVSRTLARECAGCGVGGAVRRVGVARSLLRYLYLAGLLAVSLEWAVPSVPSVRSRLLPRGVPAEKVRLLLAGCDRGGVVGRRDYAMLLLMIRLGVRASEVAAVELDDVRWRAGELLVRGKGGRRDLLPIPVDVGEALADYLRLRPRCEHRWVFVRLAREPLPITRQTIGLMVRDACARAGIEHISPHQLRHTAASAMLSAGASLGEIAQVLRHTEQQTTAVYARIDRERLRSIARAWPEV